MIKCQHCDNLNRESARFCDQCGQLLANSKHQPAEPTPTSTEETQAYTPRHLTEKVLKSRAALEGEIKQVTVLFVDIRSSMLIQDKLGAERWHHVLDRFFSILSEAVHAHEGTVNQYTGDGIMALFGAPVAHEDHARRACHAALFIKHAIQSFAEELRQEDGIDFAIRVGLNSGEVVVGRIGDDLRMDYTAQGHTVGLAARMEQLARANCIYVSGQTRSLVEGLFQFKSRGDLRIKGANERIAVFELLSQTQARSRFEAASSRRLSPFINREHELTILTTALEAAQQGHGQIIALKAETGLGKSRLCHEFRLLCTQQKIPVYEARGVSHTRAAPLQPFAAFFRDYFGIGHNVTAEDAREQIRIRLARIDAALLDYRHIVYDFLDVGRDDSRRLEPDAQQTALFDLTRAIIEYGGLNEVGVLIIENLQWIDDDDESAAFLQNLLSAAKNSHVLIILSYRPVYQFRWPKLPHFKELELSSLSETQSHEMLLSLMEEAEQANEETLAFVEQVQASTAGNPLFIEEVLRSLAEDRVLELRDSGYRLKRAPENLSLPSSVSSAVAARIDQLDDQHKSLLQTVAVVGRRLPLAVLHPLFPELSTAELQQQIDHLIEQQYLEYEGVNPADPDNQQLLFRQSIVQEVAYNMQLSERLQQRHQQVAEVLEKIASTGPDQALVAQHYQAASQSDESLTWWTRAADSYARTDVSEAMAAWQQVLLLCEEEDFPAQKIRLGLKACARLLHLGSRHGIDAEQLTTIEATGHQLCDQIDEPQRDCDLRAYFYSALGAAQVMGGTLNAGISNYQRGVELADHCKDPSMPIVSRVGLVYGLLQAAELAEAISVCEHAINLLDDKAEIAEPLLGRSALLSLLGLRAWLHLLTDELDLAADIAESARSQSIEREDAENEALACLVLTVIASRQGQHVNALQLAKRAHKLGNHSSNRMLRIASLGSMATVNAQLGKFDVALEQVHRALKASRDNDCSVNAQPSLMAMLAQLELSNALINRNPKSAEADPDLSAIDRQAAKANKLAREQENRLGQIEALLANIRIRGYRDNRSRGARSYKQSISDIKTLISETGARSFQADRLLAQAESHAGRGDSDGASTYLARAQTLLDASNAVTGQILSFSQTQKQVDSITTSNED